MLRPKIKKKSMVEFFEETERQRLSKAQKEIVEALKDGDKLHVIDGLHVKAFFDK